MTNKKLILLILGVFLISMIHAQGTSYCCEKLTSGAWCQNIPAEDENKCDSSFRIEPTSCEATSYCRLGCCYDSQEGTCMESTPQKVCQENKGIWEESQTCDIPQCSLGCCLIGDQAAFVSQTRCKRLSSIYGLEINFRTDIQSEMTCIASITSDVKGACVFEREFEKTCLMLTKKECAEMQEETNFHEGYLCSDDSLATSCGPSEKTTCVEGKDGVYFVDLCGNLANIYDASKINDKNYWSKILDVGESCGATDTNGNANSASCGNCDYFLGSTCKAYERGEDKAKASYGDYICRDLSCEYEGKKYEHGETWCANSKGVKNNLPGSRYFRMVCYNGEVTVEPCADYRQEVCIESDIEGFSTAACRANMWQDCVSQDNKKDCENSDRRDCKWIGVTAGQNIACVSKNSPGLNFWEVSGETEEICSLASTQCVVTYEKGLSGGKKATQNEECLTQAWQDQMNQMCIGLGDCGSKTNYIGVKGYHDEDAIYSGQAQDEEA